MTDSILVLNAGSSSLKFALYEAKPDSAQIDAPRVLGEIAGIGGRARFHAQDSTGRSLAGISSSENLLNGHEQALDALLDWLTMHAAGTGKLVAAGHRIVHGGEKYVDAIRLDDAVLRDLDALVPLARLHQPFGLSAVRALARRYPSLLQVGCFDTAFHRSMPDVASRYALPRALTASGLRRYGFHGLSYTFLAGELANRLDDFAQSRVIAAHLGSGASLCAMRGGQSIATTMGFTPLEGLVMGTRCGSIDPGILLYLLQERGFTVDALSRMLNHESGLLGLSGITADMKSLLESTEASALEAVDSYVYAIVREIGALLPCLGGLDVIAFTAGVGERSAEIRKRVCERFAWLGIALDRHANETHACRIDAAHSRVRVYVIPTDEAMVIARETLRITRAER